MTVDELRAVLLAGRLAIVPTDTVYGLAAALDSEAGVAALYALKGRPRAEPCQVLVYTDALVAEVLAPLDDRTAAAARALIPGPVTCLVPDPSGRYRAASGSMPGSVGIRAPSMTPSLDLGIPLIATSANEPGGADPRTVEEVPAWMRAAAAGIVERGRLGPHSSTVVDLRALSEAGPARLVRPGPDADAVVRSLAELGVAVLGGPRAD